MIMHYVLPILLLAGTGLSLQADQKNSAFQLAPTKVSVVQKQDTTVQKSEVVAKMNVQSASLIKEEGDENIIKVVLTEMGRPRHASNMQLIGNSGTVVTLKNLQSFKNISVPFEGLVRFKSVSDVGNIVYEREVRFVVTETGKWVLHINM